MSTTAVVGASYGDEGKGRVVDAIAGEHDYVVRYQGGANAGHTLCGPHGKLVLHQLPSGVLWPRPLNVLGPGVALDLELLCAELDALQARGLEPRLAISSRAQLVLEYHRALERGEEARLGARAFGSTRQGIAPFYADKHAKLGVLLDDCFEPARLRRRIEAALAPKAPLWGALYAAQAPEPGVIAQRTVAAFARIERHVCDTDALLAGALSAQHEILLEGQLGALRDLDHGCYPFVTSSSPLAGFAAVGAGVPPWAIARVIAVTKAYTTAVGAGPFVSELHGAAARALRARGGDAGEYGATTGRPRRVGWLDAVATRHGCRAQGATEVALTCLDVLGYLREIPICVGYTIDGHTRRAFPTPRLLERAQPIYERLPGWNCPLAGVRSFGELPAQARAYVRRVERLLELPVRWVSVGPERERLLRAG